MLLPASARGRRGGCRLLPGSSLHSLCLSTVYLVTLMHVEAVAGSVVLTNRTAPRAASNRWVGTCRVPSPATSRTGRSGQRAVEGGSAAGCLAEPGHCKAVMGVQPVLCFLSVCQSDKYPLPPQGFCQG